MYSGDDFYGDDITSPTARPTPGRIIRATRRSARAALDRQLVGGFAVDLPRGRIVFHSAPGLWVLATRGADDEYFHSIDAVLDAVFGGAR